MATYLQWKEKHSLFHRRRRVHTISTILSCLVDSAVIRKDDSSVQNMDQISLTCTSMNLIMDKEHTKEIQSLFGNLVGGKYLSARVSYKLHAGLFAFMHSISCKFHEA